MATKESFDFGPRSDRVRTSFGPRKKKCSQSKPNPGGFGKALQWSAAWSAAAVVACAAASELVHFDRRCVNRISTWREIIDVLAQAVCHAAGASSSKWRRITPGLGSGMLCTTSLALGVLLGNR